jgi:hypothetical protein
MQAAPSARWGDADPLQRPGPAERVKRLTINRRTRVGGATPAPFNARRLPQQGIKRVRNEAAEGAIAAIANKATYAGSGAALYGGMTANEWAAIGGLVCAVIGVLVQWYYKRKSDKREAELHTERLRELRES